MNKYKLGVSLFTISAALTQAVMAEPRHALSEIVVWGKERDVNTEMSNIDPRHVAVTTPDVADLLAYVPGADVVANGPVAGQVEYRGMFGPRVSVQLDGIYVNSGGPNLMDPPLHYMPEPLLDSLSVVRGIAPVSFGTSIGGVVRARAKSSEFTTSDSLELQADLSASYRAVNESHALGGMVGAGSTKARLHVLGSIEEGGDRRFDGGKVSPEDFKRRAFGLGGGVQIGETKLGADFRHLKTDHAGNAALPMDTQLIDTSLARLSMESQWGDMAFESQISFTDVEHEMDNFRSRQAPANPAMYRLTKAKSDSISFKAKAGITAAGGTLSIGADGHFDEHGVDIFNPNNAGFFVNSINQASQDEASLFVEWEGNAGDWDVLAGLRYAQVKMDAGEVGAASSLPAGVHMLAAAFNASDRSTTDHNFDVVLRLAFPVSDAFKFVLAAGRKTRSPSYLERFAWLPTQASGGLADGNNYVGDVDLDPEVSHEVEAGFDWDTGRTYLTPRVFYRQVDDYIQGAPVDATIGVVDSPLEMVSAMNGDTTPLRFSNVDAELYGVDGAWGHEINDHWHVDGLVSYVKGKRRDINDNLYRIAPLRGVARLSYMTENWSTTLEVVGVKGQKGISVTNGEQKTPGYGLVNVQGEWQVTPTANIVAGVNNVFDRGYAEHLGGLNRVMNSDVAVGVKLPGDGRNFFIRLSYSL